MRRAKLLIAFVISFLAVVCSPAVAAGQGGTVRGRVADSTGVPIAQAVVVLDPGGQRATTRDNGEYSSSRVPAGTYTVRVRRLGYVTPAASVLVADGQTVQQDFFVRRNLFDVYPDRMSENNGFDIFPWPPASPFGYNGRYVYTRVELTGR